MFKMERTITLWRPGGVVIAEVVATTKGIELELGDDLTLTPAEAEELAREIKRAALFLYEQGMT